jgi:hypothetical protein
MDPQILDRVPVEVKVLWELSKKHKLSSSFTAIVRDHIRRHRCDIRYENADPLFQKATNFPEEGSWARAKIRELAHALYEDKKPDSIDLGKWVSVEIECIMPQRSAETALASFLRKNGYQKYVTIKDDGSIHPDRPDCEGHLDEDGNRLNCDCPMDLFGKEIVVTFKYGEWDMLTAICKKIGELGCTVNKTCGLHVHFDCRHLSPRQAGTLGKRVALTIPALKQLLPKSRQDNGYCKTNINKMYCRGRDDRYYRYAFVNMMAYPKHRTIEIRGHSGTTDANKIINWIRLIHVIMAKRNTKPIQTASELITVFKLENDMAAYVAERVEKFAKTKVKTEKPKDDVTEDNVSAFSVSEPIDDVAIRGIVERLSQRFAEAAPTPAENAVAG